MGEWAPGRGVGRRRQEAEAEEDGAAGGAGLEQGEALHGAAWLRRRRGGRATRWRPQVRRRGTRCQGHGQRRPWMGASPLKGDWLRMQDVRC